MRGKYPSELDEEIAYKIGSYFGKLCHGKEILVGCDARLSSESLWNALLSGISAAGAKICALKFVTTPMLYYADKMLLPAASIMITASHSPKDCNGFKMILDGKPFFGSELDKLKEYILSDNSSYSKINSEENDCSAIVNQYIDRIIENIVIDPNLKIIWDSGNSIVGKILDLLLPKLPNHNIHINNKVDGNFPNRSPDQMEKGAMDELSKTVLSEKYDLGISFDGDGDRVIFVSSYGNIISNDHTLCIFAKDILKKHPGALMIADVKTSQTFFEYVAKLGGTTEMTKTGHAFIKDRIAATGALFAGELSSHMFFADDYYGFDDGIYAALRMIDILSRNQQNIHTLSSSLPHSFVTGEMKFKASDEEKFQIVDSIKNRMIEMGRKFIDIDGIRYNCLDGWWLIRASNTESSIIARAESMTIDGLSKVKEDLSQFLKF